MESSRNKLRLLGLRLVSYGFSFSWVSRLLRELHDHLAESREARAVVVPRGAGEAESGGLGSARVIADRYLQAEHKRSFWGKYPFVVFIVVPLDLILLLGLCIGLGLAGTLSLLRYLLIEAGAVWSDAVLGIGRILLHGWDLTAPVVIAVFLCRTCDKLYQDPRWPLAGVILAGLIGLTSGFTIEGPFGVDPMAFYISPRISLIFSFQLLPLQGIVPQMLSALFPVLVWLLWYRNRLLRIRNGWQQVLALSFD